MKHLIIYAHPGASSLNHHFKTTIEQSLRAQGHEVLVSDLNAAGFDPVLSQQDIDGQRKGQVAAAVAAEQARIQWAEVLVFIYPIWWTGMPAIMKGYIDRVFSYGFAYAYHHGVQQGLLAGKKAIIINTQGKSQAVYAAMGMDQALLLTSDEGIFSYCGLEVLAHRFFDQADRANPDTIAAWTQDLQAFFLTDVRVGCH